VPVLAHVWAQRLVRDAAQTAVRVRAFPLLSCYGASLPCGLSFVSSMTLLVNWSLRSK